MVIHAKRSRQRNLSKAPRREKIKIRLDRQGAVRGGRPRPREPDRGSRRHQQAVRDLKSGGFRSLSLAERPIEHRQKGGECRRFGNDAISDRFPARHENDWNLLFADVVQQHVVRHSRPTQDGHREAPRSCPRSSLATRFGDSGFRGDRALVETLEELGDRGPKEEVVLDDRHKLRPAQLKGSPLFVKFPSGENRYL